MSYKLFIAIIILSPLVFYACYAFGSNGINDDKAMIQELAHPRVYSGVFDYNGFVNQERDLYTKKGTK